MLDCMIKREGIPSNTWHHVRGRWSIFVTCSKHIRCPILLVLKLYPWRPRSIINILDNTDPSLKFYFYQKNDSRSSIWQYLDDKLILHPCLRTYPSRFFHVSLSNGHQSCEVSLPSLFKGKPRVFHNMFE